MCAAALIFSLSGWTLTLAQSEDKAEAGNVPETECAAENTTTTPGAATEKPNDARSKDVASLITANPKLSTLAAAIQAAGLTDVLKGEGPFTIFAPSNEAFATIDATMLEALLKPDNKAKLVDVLTYHVYPGKVMAKDALKLSGKEITMANKQKAKITADKKQISINNANVIEKDIVGKNGVIHIIDAVIIPGK
ncbi:MAG: fasciclin domain-containing protein [Lachnospiraceae bacterium]|nr:fasciclin domain-containing protein [Lachnospiraceae bacterium]